MQTWKKFSRVLLFLCLLISLLVGASAPARMTQSASAAPMRAPLDRDLSLTMTVPASAILLNVGDTVTFTIKVKNNGTTIVTGITAKDVLPAGLTYKSDDGGGTYNTGNGIWTIGSLGAGLTAQLRITATVTQTGSKINVAEVWFSDNLPDPNSTPGNGLVENDFASVTINPLIANLSITKGVNNATPNKDEDIIFTLKVSNAGPDSGSTITVKDLLPAGLTWVSDDSGGSYNSATGIWAVGTLLTGGADTLKITAKVTTIGVKTNSAEVWTSDQYDPNSAVGNGIVVEDDYASVTITPQTADLSLTKTIVGNSAPALGDPVAFTLTVTNAGPDTATGVTVKDLLASDFTYVSDSTGGVDYSSGSGLWTVGTLANGASATLTINTTAANSNVQTNWAEVFASEQYDPDSTPGEGSKTADDDDGAPSADLSVTKTVNTATVNVGSNVVFTVTVNNAGPGHATGVSVKDSLPSGLTYISDDGSGAYIPATGIWSVGTLANGANAVLKITARANVSGIITNWAEVWASNQLDIDSIPGDGSTTSDDDASSAITSSYPTKTVIISEVAWGGTLASSSDEWIELYNPGLTPVDITGWKLNASDGSPSINLNSVILAPGQYYILATGASIFSATDIPVVSVNQTFSGSLSNGGEILRLFDSSNTIIDTANSTGGAWIAGSDSPNYESMERVMSGGIAAPDNIYGWITNNRSSTWKTHDTVGNLVHGTPGNPNWAFSVTITPTSTSTGTLATPTGTLATPTRTATPTLNLLINEVAWMGTVADGADEWIELYNPGAAVNLAGWTLASSDGYPTINLTGTIPAGGYFVIAANSSVFNDLTPNMVFSFSLSNSGKILKLVNSGNITVDTANSDGNEWPAGLASPTYASMERTGKVYDGASTWATYASPNIWAHDRDNVAIKGTPGRANWATTVTLTPTKTVTPTGTPVRAATSTLYTPTGRPVINEFLPRPGFDWNQDGKVDVFDEFIEIKNIGNANISLNGWVLDDDANKGSAPYTLPDITLKPGERTILYGLQTNILLGDGGDTVRLLNPSGKIFDAYTYDIVKVEDRSICRLPDGNGSWYEDCIPTPNLINTREGQVPSMPGDESFESPVCELPDTLPVDFLFAECRGYGSNIWHSFYWDEAGWQGDQSIFEKTSRWESFIE